MEGKRGTDGGREGEGGADQTDGGQTRWRKSGYSSSSECSIPDSIPMIWLYYRISANTMEQVVISCSGSLILSMILTQSQMKIIPIIAINAFISRLLFMWGYHQTTNTKISLGFGPLMITNFATYAVNIYLFVNSPRN